MPFLHISVNQDKIVFESILEISVSIKPQQYLTREQFLKFTQDYVDYVFSPFFKMDR